MPPQRSLERAVFDSADLSSSLVLDGDRNTAFRRRITAQAYASHPRGDVVLPATSSRGWFRSESVPAASSGQLSTNSKTERHNGGTRRGTPSREYNEQTAPYRIKRRLRRL
jgi:hypothetical protein